jgi:hypothetical protein
MPCNVSTAVRAVRELQDCERVESETLPSSSIMMRVWEKDLCMLLIFISTIAETFKNVMKCETAGLLI